MTFLSSSDRVVLCVSDPEEVDSAYEAVRYRKVFLDDEDAEVDPDDKDGRSAEASPDQHEGDDERYHYSDDHESCSDDDAGQQEAGE